jgi:hypothetical protein
MKGLYACFLILLFTFLTFAAFSQTDGDYRTRQTGNWNTVTTWQVFNSGWQNLEDAGAGPFQGVTPTSSSGAISVQSGHTVAVPSGFSVTIDQTIVNSNARFDIFGTVTVSNGAGNDLEFYNDGEDYGFLTAKDDGLLIVNDLALLIGTTNSTATFEDGSTYRHLYTATEGRIPIASWGTSSLIEILGYTYTSTVLATGAGNWNQTFGNFTFNSPLGTGGVFNFAGLLLNIAGELRVEDTGAGRINLSTTQSPTITIGSDFSILGTARVNFNSAGICTVNVGRDFIFNSTSATPSQTNTTGTTTINVARHFSMNASGGTLNLAAGSGAGSGTINVSRNFTLTAGTISENSDATGVGDINFTGSTAATFLNTGSITQNVNFSVASLKTLNLGTSALQGTGSFTLNGTIGLGSLDSGGALQTGNTGGNIRVTGVRTYASNSTIVYNGTGPQFIGNGFPSGGDVNLTINNTGTPPNNTVTLSDNLDIVALRVLTLTNGNIVIGTQTLTINGTVTGSGGLVGGSLSNLIIGGTGNFGILTFSGTNQLLNFTINRTSSGLVTLGDDLTVLGTFTQTAGNIAIAANTFTVSGNFSRTNGAFVVTNASTIVVDGTGTLPSDVGISGATLGTLTLDRAGSSFATSATLDITSLNLTSGIFANGTNIGITSGGTITRSEDGSMTNSPNNTTNTYNLVYDAGSAITTGPELTSSATALNNVTKLGSSTVTLTKAITINGDLILSNGNFNASTFGVTLKDDLISNAPANFETSALVFAGGTTISGNTPPNFNNFTINSGSALNLGAGTTVNVSGNITNNGDIFGATSTIVFDGNTLLDGGGTSPLKGDFNNIQIASAGTFAIGCAACTVSNPYRIDVSGNFTVLTGGTFTENLSIVRLVGTTGQTLAMDGENFNILQVSGTSTVSLSEPLLVSEDLTVSINATLDTGPGSQMITIGDDVTINGTFIPNSGTVTFNGGGGQTVGRSDGTSVINFYNISISKPATTTFGFTTPVGIINSIAITQPGGAYSVDFGGTVNAPNVTLLSNSVTGRTGHVLGIPDGVTITGNVRVNRFMEPAPSHEEIYRYISSPINANPVSQLQDDFPLTGPFAGANTCPAFKPGVRNMYYYNEASAGTSENGYVGFPSATSDPMTSGRGYAVQMCDGASIITWDVSGSIRRATTAAPVPLPVTYTNHSLPNDDGLNLVGNPFPAPLDWEAAGWVKTNITNTFWIRNNKEANIASYNGDLNQGTNGATQYIALGQAFWVQATAPSPALSITETVKADQQPEFFRAKPLSDLLRMMVSHDGFSDEIILHFDELADDASNSFGDSRKFFNGFLNLYSIGHDSVKLAINSLNGLTCSHAVSLGLSDVKAGNYSFTFNGFETFTDVSMTLVDKWKGISTPLKGGTIYSFEVTEDVNSFGTSRFDMVFTKGEGVRPVIAEAPEMCEGEATQLTIADPQIGITYYAVNASGKVVSSSVTAKAEDALHVDLTLTAGDHQITLMASRAGCSVIPVAALASVQVMAKPSINSVNDAFTCGAGSTTVVVTATEGGVQYNWYESIDAVNPIEITTVGEWDTPIIDAPRQYFVSSTNVLGCEGPRAPVNIEVRTLKNPFVQIEEGRLVTTDLGTLEWYWEGDRIQEGGASLELKDAGEYTLKSTQGGCVGISSIQVDPEQLSEGSRVKISPNPAVDHVNIEIYSTASEVRVSLIAATGQEISAFELNKSGTQNFSGSINLKETNAGLYILRIAEDNHISYKRLIRK